MNRSPLDIGQVNRLLAPAGSALRGCWRQRNIWPIHEAPVWIVPCLEGVNPTSHLGLIHLSRGSKYAPGSESARPRGDADYSLSAIREGGGGRTRVAAECPFLCLAAPASRWAGSGQSAVYRSPMPFSRIGGVSLTGNHSGSKCSVSSAKRSPDWRPASAAPQNATDLFSLSNESINGRCVYRIETGQSLLDLCVGRTKDNCTRGLSNLR
jgi:hypothetical protein